MNKLRAAVSGLGKMGLSHTAIASAHPMVELVSVCDTSSFILEGFRKFTNVRTYTDYQKMLDSEDIDLVIIATPTKYHFPMVRYALEKNIHVFCEKPLALNARDGEELARMAKAQFLVNQVGYHNHFIGTFQELKRLLKENVIGDLVHFTGEAYGPVVTREKGGTWRAKPEEGGGCLFDYASHVINLIQEIIGHPVMINGTLMKSIYSKGVDDAVFSLMTLENKLSGILLVNWSDASFRKMSTSVTLIGKKGKIFCDATELRIFLNEANRREGLSRGWTIRDITSFALPVSFHLRGEEYSAQIDYFISNVFKRQNGRVNTFDQANYTDKVIEMIVESIK